MSRECTRCLVLQGGDKSMCWHYAVACEAAKQWHPGGDVWSDAWRLIGINITEGTPHPITKKTHFAHFPISPKVYDVDFLLYPSDHHPWTWMTSKTNFYQIGFSHYAWPSWQFAMECNPAQLRQKWLPSFFNLYFLSLVLYAPWFLYFSFAYHWGFTRLR